MMYSTAMPVLFPFACIFYILFYWVYKFLLLKYYERTTRFNQELPIYILGWMKFALVLHGLFSLLMISDSNLMPIEDPWEAYLEYAALGQEKFSFLKYGQLRILKRPYCAILLFFYLGVLAFFLAEATAWRLLMCLCRPCCKRSEFAKVEPIMDSDGDGRAHSGDSDDILKDYHIKPLTALYQRLVEE